MSRLQTDTIRGIACLMLVAYHVVGSTHASGMGVGAGSYYRIVIADGPLLVRMPLFTFLSGFVYAYRPVRSGDVGTFVTKKVRRLLIPMVVVSTIAALLRLDIEAAGLWRIYIWPFGVYWYLHALLLIFLLVVVLDRLHLMDRASHFGMVFGVAVVLFLLASRTPTEFALNRAVYLLPFFLWGVGVNRFSQIVVTKVGRSRAIALGVTAVVANVLVLGLGVNVPHGRLSAFGLIVALCVTLGLLTLAPASRWLARLGGYSYGIFLYHKFGITGSRNLVRKVVDVDLIVFVVGVVVGVAFSIAVCELVRRTSWSRLLFLGESRRSTQRRAGPIGPTVATDDALGA